MLEVIDVRSNSVLVTKITDAAAQCRFAEESESTSAVLRLCRAAESHQMERVSFWGCGFSSSISAAGTGPSSTAVTFCLFSRKCLKYSNAKPL